MSHHRCALRLALALALLLALAFPAQAQHREYVRGEVILKFRDGALDRNALEQEADTFSLDGILVRDVALRNKLLAEHGQRLRRVVRRLRPSHQVSIARTGQEIAIPDLYNLMVLEVPQQTDIPRLVQALSQWEGIVYAEPNYVRRPMTRIQPPRSGKGQQRTCWSLRRMTPFIATRKALSKAPTWTLTQHGPGTSPKAATP
jgi:hypothetical protein